MKPIIPLLAFPALLHAQGESIDLKQVKKGQSHYGMAVGFTSFATTETGNFGYMTGRNPSMGLFVDIKNYRFPRPRHDSFFFGLVYHLRASFDAWDEAAMPGFISAEKSKVNRGMAILGLGMRGGQAGTALYAAWDVGVSYMGARTTYAPIPKIKSTEPMLRLALGLETGSFVVEGALEMCSQNLGFQPDINDLDPQDKKTKWNHNKDYGGFALAFGFRL